jgi:hypothetical protein
MALAERLPHPRQARLGRRRDQQMHMIGHEHSGVHRHSAPGGSLPRPIAIEPAILILGENRLPIVSPLDHVQRQPFAEIPAQPRPRPSPAKPRQAIPKRALISL